MEYLRPVQGNPWNAGTLSREICTASHSQAKARWESETPGTNLRPSGRPQIERYQGTAIPSVAGTAGHADPPHSPVQRRHAARGGYRPVPAACTTGRLRPYRGRTGAV